MSYDRVPQDTTLKVEPYTLAVPQEDVDHFYQLLKLSKLAPKTYENLQKDPIAYGVTHEWMSNAKSHWETSYDWRKREAHINSFPNFQTKINDTDDYTYTIHFAALFSNKPNAIPIVFLHGWPGSFLEFLGVLSTFRDKYTPDTLPYHIIAPSLPGYCLSSGPPLNKNSNTQDIARVVDKLMTGLFPSSKYVAQGGDIGAYTCRPLSKYPSCAAVHLNFSLMSQPSSVPPSSDSITDTERAGVKQASEFASTQSAYALEHGTRPATIGFTLSSSPVALLSWIGEKFLTWTDTTPDLDDILDSVTLYWFTESFPRCIYPYRQFHGASDDQYTIHDDPKYFIEQPLGYSYFPKELAPMPVAWVATTGNLVWSKVHGEGGHFAAMEQPKLMVEDVEEFVGQVWT